jgi:hypothetical protein
LARCRSSRTQSGSGSNASSVAPTSAAIGRGANAGQGHGCRARDDAGLETLRTLQHINGQPLGECCPS